MASPPEDSRYDHPEKWTHSHSLPVDLCGPELLSKARILAETQFGSCKTRGPDSLGFLLGSSGVFALNAVIARSLWQGEESEEKFLTLFRNCCQDLLAPDPLGCGSDEVNDYDDDDNDDDDDDKDDNNYDDNVEDADDADNDDNYDEDYDLMT